ncbi:MAG: alpha/beta hydrolase [Acidimicrobiia bacterium]|nr:alpha/beta hydrolase [Acidimicrobiia bacterium]
MASVDHSVEILTSADGEPVALHDFGGSGPSLLLAHGNGLNAGMWAGVVPHLVDRYRCFGIDLRGHGACRPIDPHYSVDRNRFGEDVLACVDRVGAPVLYAGHSLGGASAIFAALHRPEAFEALWLYEPVLVPQDLERPEGHHANLLIEASRRRRMTFDSVDDAFERFRSKPPFSDCDAAAVRAYVEIGTYPTDDGVRLSCEGENEARVFETSEALDFGRLAGIDAPTVVAAGGVEDDAHALPALVASMVADALGNARLERHRDLSHLGPMEAPADIAASIRRHLGSG